jgi:hypothetical protein
METLYRVGYRNKAARHAIRYVRAVTAHEARTVAVSAWGMNGTPIAMARNWAPDSYGLAGYVAWSGADVEVIDSRMAAACAVAAKANREDTLRKLYDPKKARIIARQHSVTTI